jgi:hypothetical protein
MRLVRELLPKVGTRAVGTIPLIALLVVASAPAFCQKAETIEATAMGTGTQMGQIISVRLLIYDYSTIEERETLLQAFTKGQNQGLVNALSKMRAVGRIAITGTLGFDVSFIRVIPTPTGRTIRFVTNRPITFAESWTDAQTQAFNLSGGELDLNDTDKTKSTGVLFPLAQLSIDKQGQLQIDLNQNSWKLVDILDWKGTAGIN